MEEDINKRNIQVFEDIILEELKTISNDFFIEELNGYVKIDDNIIKILKGFKINGYIFIKNKDDLNRIQERLKETYKDTKYNVACTKGYNQFKLCLILDQKKVCFENEGINEE